jgi:hypothetical protein
MAFVEIRRFYERNEAFIAKAALESAGLGAMIRDNGYASMYFGAAIATGGYGLFVIDDDIEAAREVLLEAVPPAPESLNWTEHPQHLSGLPLAAIGTFSGLVAGAPTLLGSRQRVTWVGLVGTAATILIAVPILVLLLRLI